MRAAAWAFTTVAALTWVLCTATAATAGGGTGLPAAGRDGPGLTIFRIDVSKYPQVGIVVTVPGTPRGLAAADFSIMSGGHASRPWARQLSPDDIELVLAPDTSLRATELRPEQAASARFLVSLPTGAQTGVVNPYRPVQRPVGLSGDPTAGAAQVATLGGQASS